MIKSGILDIIERMLVSSSVFMFIVYLNVFMSISDIV